MIKIHLIDEKSIKLIIDSISEFFIFDEEVRFWK